MRRRERRRRVRRWRRERKMGEDKEEGIMPGRGAMRWVGGGSCSGGLGYSAAGGVGFWGEFSCSWW